MSADIIDLAAYQTLRGVARDLARAALDEDRQLASYLATMYALAKDTGASDRSALLQTVAIALEDALDTVLARGDVTVLRETVAALRRVAERDAVRGAR